MKLYEYQAAKFFEGAGIPVVESALARGLQEGKDAAERMGYPVVLKAQVLAGGRGKAGGIKIVYGPGQLEVEYQNIRGMAIQGHLVQDILVAKAVDIKREFYLAVTLDSAKDDAVVIFSEAGGVDIENAAKTAPEEIHRFYLGGNADVEANGGWLPFWEGLRGDPACRKAVMSVARSLIKVFFGADCTLAEINPLAITRDGDCLALDSKMILDDSALFRHEEFRGIMEASIEDPDDRDAKSGGLSYVKLDGNIGCMVNGAGLAMGTMDMIQLLGGRPANFLDVGGSSNPEKVVTALNIILRNPKIKVILVNIFGGITRCDDIARGLLDARRRLDFNVPLVVRLTGTNEQAAKDILMKENIPAYSAMREAVDRAVGLAR